MPSSVADSPMLSLQKTLSLSPLLGALEPEADQRILGNAGAGTDLPRPLAVEFDIQRWMKCGGIFLSVFLSVRSPVSIGCDNQYLQLHARRPGRGCAFSSCDQPLNHSS